MSALANIENLLQELNDYAASRSPAGSSTNNKPVFGLADPKAIATDIAELTLNEIAEQDLDYVSSLFFQEGQGILRFLRSNVRSREAGITAAQTVLLEFLVGFIEKAKSILQPYAVSIKNCCITMTSAASARVRCAAIDVLIVLMNPTKSQLDVTQSSAKAVFEQFTREFTLAVTKTPATVKGRILELLGMIVRYYPEHAVDEGKVKTLQRWCLDTLDNQLFQQPKVDNSLVAGALRGLTSMASSRKYRVITEPTDKEKLYKIIATIFDLPEDLSRYMIPLAALDFFSYHAELLGVYLVDGSEKLYKDIKKLCSHKNNDISKSAYKALESLLKQIAKMLAGHKAEQKEKRIFQFFIGAFLKDLQADYNEIDYRDLSASIRGIGYFSKACKEYMQPEEIQVLRDYLVRLSNWFYSEINSEQTRLLTHIPAFVQAYSQFARNLETLPQSYISMMSKIVDVLMTNYQRLSSYTRTTGTSAVQELLRTLSYKGEGTLRNYLSHFFYNTLVLTCSDTAPSSGVDYHQTYMDFLYFWENLLKSDDDKFRTVLHDEFLLAFLRLVKAFNLDVVRINEAGDEESHTESNPGYVGTVITSLRPVNEKDFILFENLVEFWCLLLPKLGASRRLLRDWIHVQGTALIELSLRKPLVSGFYRMLTAILSLAENANLFHGYKNMYIEQQKRKQFGQLCESQTDVYAVYAAFREYLREVRHRLQQYKDELLASSLKLVLAYPLAFFDVQELIGPLQTALSLGLSYLPLAVTALETIERLVAASDEKDPDVASLDFLNDVLPYMNEYLSIGWQEKGEKPGQKSKINLKASARLKRVIHEQPTPAQLGVPEDLAKQAGLRDIQLRMMRFFGRIGGYNKLILDQPQNAKNAGSQLLAWDPERRLRIRLPFANARLHITVDEILPRICELAESSPDRQAKVAACELLHGLVLVMIGTSAFQARDRREPTESRYHRLYLRVFPILLRLAVDLDQVPREMFRTLISQLIHWLTNNAQYENPETIALLHTCLDAACSTNAALRDYGAECLQEFVKWSIKQTVARADEGPMNVKSVLKRLYNLASNPSASQRLGASLIFNRIYRIFREEQTLVDEFTLELLYWLFFSLRLAEDDHPSIGTREQAKEAISHVKRILHVRASVFQTESRVRRPFPGGTERADIQSVVEWAFQQTGQLQREYAKACMDFFFEFVHTLPGVKDAKQWIRDKARAKNNTLLTDVYETQRLVPTSPSDKRKTATSCILWLRQLICALDGYVWLLERDMVDPMDILNQGSSVLLEALRFYLRHPPSAMVGEEDHSLDKSRVQALYAYAGYRLMCLLNLLVVVDHEQPTEVLENASVLFDTKLVDLVAQMLLLPDEFLEPVQADQGTLSVWLSSRTPLRQAARRFAEAMANFGPPKFTRLFARAACAIMDSENIDLTTLERNQGTLNDMMQSIDGILILQEIDLLDKVRKEANRNSGKATSAEEYCTELFDKFNELNATDEPVWINLLGNMLKIAFRQPGFAESHATDLLLNPTLSFAERLTLYQRYNRFMNEIIATNFKEFSSLLISNIDDELINHVILAFPEYLKMEKSRCRLEIACVTKDLLDKTPFLSELVDAWETRSNLTDLVSFLRSLFSADPGIVSRAKNKPVFASFRKALAVCLRTDAPLSLKNEAFDIIPMYICIEGEHVDEIGQWIKDTVDRQFPSSSKELKAGTEAFNDYIHALDKLLNLMASFQSVMIFNILLPTFIQEEDHVHSAAIEQSIAKFAKGLGRPSFVEVAQSCFSYFKDNKLDMKRRQNVITLIVNLLALVPDDYVISFYEENIVYIMSVIKRELLRRGTDQEVIDDMEEKHTLYQRLSAPKVHGPDSKISAIWEKAEQKSGQGRKMTIDLVGMAHSAKNQKHPPENEAVAAARLRYHQAAYNAAAAAILRTQKSEKFFVGFLIQDKPNEPLWENIVDMNQSVNLVVELDRPLMRSRVESFRAKSGQAAANTGADYMPSIGLTGSSLSQMSLSDMALEASGRGPAEESPVPKFPLDEEEEEVEVADVMITGPGELELDQFNANPCMNLLVEIIRRLHLVICPPNADNKVPMWMNELLRFFTKKDTPLILRLFLTKLIVNCPEAFENYASHWIRPLMELAIQGDQYGEPMNYFVQDICVLLIVWGQQVQLESTYEDRCLLYNFVNYLVRNAYHESPRILRNNIQTIKGVFDNWHSQIIVPTKLIYEYINQPGDVPRKNQTGLQLVGIILAHDVNPYYDGPEVDLGDLDEGKFYATLCNNISQKPKEIYADASEASAWALEFRKSHGLPYEDLEKMIVSKIKMMDPLLQKTLDYPRFLTCLKRVQLHYPDITKQFVTKVIYLLPQLFGHPKVTALQIIAACSGAIENPFQTMESKGLFKMIRHRNDEAQLALLEFLQSIASTLTPEQIEDSLEPLVNAFVEHPNHDCRVMFYGILKRMNDSLMDASPVKDKVKVHLLRGFIDPSQDIRQDLLAYMQRVENLTDNIYERVTTLLKTMYLPEIENLYILYGTQLLLDGTKQSFDYDKPIFDDPLPNAKFDENYQQINTSWQRNMSMTPLFVASQERAAVNPEELENQVRATQTALFSLTQSATGGGTLASSFAPPVTQAMLYASPTQTQQRGEGQVGGTMGQPEKKTEDTYSRLRRRFFKATQGETHAFFRKRHDEIKKRLQRYQMLAKQAREKKVTMYRNYRIGELPDIQIKHADLIVPLQALGRSDNEIARLLHAGIIVATTQVAEDLDSYKADIVATIQRNLEKSTLYFPPVIGSFLRICFELDGGNIDSAVIKSVSDKSYSHHIGIALLEKQLEKGEEYRASKKSRTSGKMKIHGSKKQWIDLATLYKAIDEPEIFQSLYKTKVATLQLPKDAIDAEIQGDYANACNLLTDAFEIYAEEIDQEELIMWEQERLRCYEQLTQWHDIATYLEADFKGQYNAVWEENEKEMYIYYMFRSFVKLRQGLLDEQGDIVPWTGDRPNPIFQFVSSATADPDKMDFLLQNHASDISLVSIYQADYDRARFYIRHAYESLLLIWASLHPLSHASRMLQLARLERAAEIEDFLEVVANLRQGNVSPQRIEKYMKTLFMRYPDDKLDDMATWDDILDARSVFIGDIEAMTKDNTDIYPTVQKLAAESRKRHLMSMILAARQQSNFNVAYDRFKHLSNLGLEPDEKRFTLLNVDLQLVKATKNGSLRIQKLARMVGNIDRNESNLDPSSSQNFYGEYMVAAAKTFELARMEVMAEPSSYESMIKIPSLATRKFKDATMFANYLVRNGYRFLQAACNSALENENLWADCLWSLAEYCDNALRGNEDRSSKISVKIDVVQYGRVVINNYFKAMDTGNRQAAERFPRLLEIIERYPETGSEFKANASKFETTWMYIRWIPQLVAILDSPVALNVFPALHKLASSYPQALYYPFAISNEHYIALGDKLDKKNREELKKLQASLESPLLREFSLELRRLTNPEHIVKDFIEFAQSICSQADVSKEFVQQMFQQFSELLLNPYSDRLGTIPKAFAVKHASQLREFFGKDGSKLIKMSSKDLNKAMQYFKKEIQSQKLPGQAELLRSYSPWLSSFQSADHDEQIEVPGQYSGLTKPYPELHPKIASFDERLLVMSSIRKPKRLQIYGTDEKKYPFLVKGGEDLRLDQRIQQLFVVMNEIIRADPFCARQNIRINTYKVVPMSSNIGMIEWVNDTKPLRSCIEEQLRDKLPLSKAIESHRVWISRFRGDTMGYINSFKAPRDAVVKHFEQTTGLIKQDAFRQYLFKLAASPEAFLFIRKEFAHSLAAICISGYLLGIGDRHLENFLVDLKSGRLVPIDFGHAFGSATEMLPVPELVPFRLTNQLVGALEPLGVSGILAASMTNILQALQQNKQVLLNTMDVFIKEPLLDWRKQAIKEAQNQRGASSSSTRGARGPSSSSSSSSSEIQSPNSLDQEIAWYPQQKLESAKRKLLGENPAYTVTTEVQRNRNVKHVLSHLEKMAKGDSSVNIRAQVGEFCKDAGEQVQCLIDLATDPSILGRMWVGWQPFV